MKTATLTCACLSLIVLGCGDKGAAPNVPATGGTDGSTSDHDVSDVSGGGSDASDSAIDLGYPDAKPLAAAILNDPDIATTKALCQTILANGFNAGSGYPQVWIRDTKRSSKPCWSSSRRNHCEPRC